LTLGIVLGQRQTASPGLDQAACRCDIRHHQKLVGHMSQTELRQLIRLLEKARRPLDAPG